MVQCAYCDVPCSATREHVIPAWYNDTPGDAETFSARAPLTHTRGDLLVKDVCERCNNEPLASLDGYGKELYDRYFSSLVYDQETVDFSFDADKLVRWLLKLSYNSGRAQNADIAVLREFRKVMLGEAALTDHIQCWLHLVSTACLAASGDVRSARRDESESSEIFEPKWFRIGQLRLPGDITTECVQRQIAINSYAFSVFVAPSSAKLPSKGINQLVKAFQVAVPAAKQIDPRDSQMTVSASDTHAIASWYPLFDHYPSRFADKTNPYIAKVPKGGVGGIILEITPEMIENKETSLVIEALNYMVSTRENAIAFRQRVVLMISGSDDDIRELWQISKAREFVCTVFDECPFFMFLAHPKGDTLRLMLACWLGDQAKLSRKKKADRVFEFTTRAFCGLNEAAYRLAISRETILEISESSSRALFGEL